MHSLLFALSGSIGPCARAFHSKSLGVVFGRRFRCSAWTTRRAAMSTASDASSSVGGDVRDVSFRFAGIQMKVTDDKDANLKKAESLISAAVSAGANVIALPECFQSPYSNAAFPAYAEEIPSGPTTQFLSRNARDRAVYIIGGSFPERDNGRLYNTSVAFDPSGKLVAKHRKLHLFDINIPGKMTFKESDTLSPGKSFTTFDTEFGKFGLAICYDLRFPQLALVYGAADVDFLVYPGAFNTTTGPAHWELLLRGRAVDNQMFIAGISPARNPTKEYPYPAWGHSTVIDPWGNVVATTEEDEDVIYADIDLKLVDTVRQQIPVRIQQRSDMYTVAWTQDE